MTWRAIALAVALALSSNAVASEPPPDAVETILSIQMDGKEVIATALIKQSPDGDVWLGVDEWKMVPGVVLDLEGKTGLLSARALGFNPVFDAASMSVNLKVPAAMRKAQALHHRQARLTRVNPQPKGALINYDIAARVQEDGQYSASFGHDLRMGVGAATLATTGQLNYAQQSSGYRRGVTSLSYDHLPTGTTVQLGDVFTQRTNLTGTVNLAGIRVGSDRDLDRGANFYPVPMLGGIAQEDSTVEIFVNGDKTNQHSVKPGPWETDGFRTRPGRNEVRMVVSDDFGRTEVIEDRFYMTPNNLARGRTEWEVAAGLVRNIGSDTYTTPAIAGKVERGVNDYWTAGVAVQATQEARNMTASTRLILGPVGALSIDAGASDSLKGRGTAFAVAYDYRTRNWGLAAGHSQYSDRYWHLGQERSVGIFDDDAHRLASTTTASLSLHPKGRPWNASVNAVSLEYVDGTTRKRAGLSARYRSGANEFGVGANISSDSDTQVYATWRHTFGGGTNMSATARRAPELETALNFSGRQEMRGRDVSWSGGLVSSETGASGWGQAAMETSKGTVSVGGQYDKNNSHIYGRFAGSVWIGEGGFASQGLSRGAFLLVDVEGQEGVPVAAGGGYNNKTNRHGVAVIPNIRPLVDLNVRIDGSSLPLETSLETTEQSAAVGRNTGGKVSFKVLTEVLQEVKLKRQGQSIEPPAIVRTDTEEAVVGVGGIAVLMKPTPGQTLEVEFAPGQMCSAVLPASLPGFSETLDLDCKETP